MSELPPQQQRQKQHSLYPSPSSPSSSSPSSSSSFSANHPSPSPRYRSVLNDASLLFLSSYIYDIPIMRLVSVKYNTPIKRIEESAFFHFTMLLMSYEELYDILTKIYDLYSSYSLSSYSSFASTKHIKRILDMIDDVRKRVKTTICYIQQQQQQQQQQQEKGKWREERGQGGRRHRHMRFVLETMKRLIVLLKSLDYMASIYIPITAQQYLMVYTVRYDTIILKNLRGLTLLDPSILNDRQRLLNMFIVCVTNPATAIPYTHLEHAANNIEHLSKAISEYREEQEYKHRRLLALEYKKYKKRKKEGEEGKDDGQKIRDTITTRAARRSADIIFLPVAPLFTTATAITLKKTKTMMSNSNNQTRNWEGGEEGNEEEEREDGGKGVMDEQLMITDKKIQTMLVRYQGKMYEFFVILLDNNNNSSREREGKEEEKGKG